MAISILAVSVLIAHITQCYGHKRYQRDIPNGDMVPDPCTADTNDVWTRVGHNIEDTKICTDKEKDQQNSFGQVSYTFFICLISFQNIVVVNNKNTFTIYTLCGILYQIFT